jgi:predicted nuclease of predicted toxin-antitoxin system
VSRSDHPAFLIDEDLSAELADMATARGFHALAIVRIPRFRGRGDPVVARYALENDMILVTNNRVDFERVYLRKEVHPGLAFICAEHTKLRTLRYQKVMMQLILDEVEKDAPVQEAIVVTARYGKKRCDVAITLERFHLPKLRSP